MTSPSNLYAEKVFAEQPIALWALDEEVYYTSQLLPSERDISSWSASEGIINLSTEKESPITGEQVFKVSIPTPVTTNGSIQVKSQAVDIRNFFSIGAYFYFNSEYIESISIGYDVDGIDYLKNILVSGLDSWIFVSDTFSRFYGNSKITFVINYIPGGTETDYDFYISGVSCGTRSEEFSAISVGSDAVALPTNIDLRFPETSDIKSVVAKSYGMQDSDAYYLSNNGKALSKNSGFPLVYGSDSSTVIYENDPIQTSSAFLDYKIIQTPSIIFPGFGFLNESGKYNDYTAEFWLKINPKFKTSIDLNREFRIFGPINSKDGIYINDSSISIRIGSFYDYESTPFSKPTGSELKYQYFGAHPIGEWDRPMLLDFSISESKASLSINGETVISIDIDMKSMQLLSKYVSTDQTSDVERIGKDQDWLGFFSNSYIDYFSIDCFAIYPYIVPDVVSKRRFVYGQGVDFPENINGEYSSSSTYADFSFSKYANSYNYPEIGAWNQGILENFVTDKKTISLPQYALPQISFNNRSEDTWKYLSYSQDQDAPIKLFPETQGEEQTHGFIYFKDLLLSNNVKASALFINIDAQEYVASSDETLLYIKDKNSNDYLEVYISASDDLVKYAITVSGSSNVLHSSIIKNYIGISFPAMSSYYGGVVSEFLSRSSLSLYVGGRPEYSQTFSGTINSVGLCSSFNLKKITEYFNTNGLMNVDEIIKQDYIASYQLHGRGGKHGYSLAIAASSYWEDYVPLSTLAKYVTDSLGNKKYSLDFIQINADSIFSKSQVNNNNGNGFIIDEEIYSHTFDSTARLYVSFKYNNISTPQEITKIKFSNNKVLDLSSDTAWANTKYEITDGTIVYPPLVTDLNTVSLVISIESDNKSIQEYPIRIKSLQISSRAQSKTESNPVGTRFGNDIYPYKKAGIFYDYSGKNPFTITKNTTPYLYMTEKTGIELVGDVDATRGISIPINVSKSDYKVIAIQSFIKLGNRFQSAQTGVPYGEQRIELFEIVSKNKTLKFYMKPLLDDQAISDPIPPFTESYNRAMIYCINTSTGMIENGISFYWNGKMVKNPVITAKEWGILGVNFLNALDFTQYSGQINITGPIMVNAISHYSATNLQELQRRVLQSWQEIKISPESGLLNWDFWLDSFLWQDVLAVARAKSYNFSAQDIYKAYTGTNKLILGDPYETMLGKYKYSIFKDSLWQSYTLQPV